MHCIALHYRHVTLHHIQPLPTHQAAALPSPRLPPPQYTYIGISLNELSGLTLSGCSTDSITTAAASGAARCVPNGEATIQQLGLNKYSMQACAGALLGYIFVCRFMAYLGLRYVKW
jgi:hypothetical protein